MYHINLFEIILTLSNFEIGLFTVLPGTVHSGTLTHAKTEPLRSPRHSRKVRALCRIRFANFIRAQVWIDPVLPVQPGAFEICG